MRSSARRGGLLVLVVLFYTASVAAITATIDPYGGFFVVDFLIDTNRGLQTGRFSCTSLFDFADAEQDLQGGSCFWTTDSVLYMAPGKGFDLRDNTCGSGLSTQLSLLANVVEEKVSGNAFPATVISIDPPAEAARLDPIVALQGPQYLSVCDDLCYDASSSYLSYGVSLAYQWSCPGGLPDCYESVSQTSPEIQCFDVAPSSDTNVSYTQERADRLRLTLINVYCVQGANTYPINTRLEPQPTIVGEAIPIVTISGPPSFTLRRSSPLDLVASGTASSCSSNPGAALSFTWSMDDVEGPTVGTAEGLAFHMDSNSLDAGVYTVVVIGTVEGTGAQSNYTVTVTVVYDELEVLILGGGQVIEIGGIISLDTRVFDPSATASANYAYSWAALAYSGGPLPSLTGTTSSLNLDTDALGAGTTLTVQVRVEDAATARVSLAFVTLSFVAASSTTFTASLDRVTGPGGDFAWVNGSETVFVNEGISLEASCVGCDADTLTCAWSLVMGDLEGSISDVTGATLVLGPGMLIDGQAVTVLCEMEDGSEKTGSATYSFTVHLSPTAALTVVSTADTDIAGVSARTGYDVITVRLVDVASAYGPFEYKFVLQDVRTGVEIPLSLWQKSLVAKFSPPEGSVCDECDWNIIAYVSDSVGSQAVFPTEATVDDAYVYQASLDFMDVGLMQSRLESALATNDYSSILGLAVGANAAVVYLASIDANNLGAAECGQPSSELRTVLLQSINYTASVPESYALSVSELTPLLQFFTLQPALINPDGRTAVLSALDNLFLPIVVTDEPGPPEEVAPALDACFQALSAIMASTAICGDGTNAIFDAVSSRLRLLQEYSLADVAYGVPYIYENDAVYSYSVKNTGGSLGLTVVLPSATLTFPGDALDDGSVYTLAVVEFKQSPFAFSQSSATQVANGVSVLVIDNNGNTVEELDAPYTLDYVLNDNAMNVDVSAACQLWISSEGGRWQTGDCSVTYSSYGRTSCSCEAAATVAPHAIANGIIYRGAGGLVTIIIVLALVLAAFVAVAMIFGVREINKDFKPADATSTY